MRMMRQQAYIMPGAKQLFLSHKALEELGCIRGKVFSKPMVSEIVGRALAKDNYVDGWMAIAGWDLDDMTAEEVEKAEALELENVMACQEALCSMGSGVEEHIGEAMFVQAKSATGIGWCWKLQGILHIKVV